MVRAGIFDADRMILWQYAAQLCDKAYVVGSSGVTVSSKIDDQLLRATKYFGDGNVGIVHRVDAYQGVLQSSCIKRYAKGTEVVLDVTGRPPRVTVEDIVEDFRNPTLLCHVSEVDFYKHLPVKFFVRDFGSNIAVPSCAFTSWDGWVHSNSHALFAPHTRVSVK